MRRSALRSNRLFHDCVRSTANLHLQTGKVELAVVLKTDKEATIGILSDGSFFGEGSLAGQPLCMGTATAMTDCAVLQIEKKAMMQAPFVRNPVRL